MDASAFRTLNRHNLQTLRRSPLAEISGSLGDLGTLLPITIALTLNSSISLSSTLVFTGLFNILTGVFFGIPLPVQPMKAIAAVALSRQNFAGETASAGLFVGGVVFVFSATGLLRWFTRVIPIPVVKGIQVGAGLSLILSAGGSLLQPLNWTRPLVGDNLCWALFAALLLLGTAQAPRFPSALVLVIFGLVLAISNLNDIIPVPRLPQFELWKPHVRVPTPQQFKAGFWDAGLGQLPLTTLNSIIAVTHLSADLLPTTPAPTTTALGFSVAGMNLLGCWFGAMPVCHGSGGLAAQHRFGARSGASVVMLGAVKMILGLFFGESIVGLLQAFPKSILGIMVLAAGLELARVGESLNQGARDLWETDGSVGEDSVVKPCREVGPDERKRRWAVMMVTVAGLLSFRNDGVGFVAGMLCHWSFLMPEWIATYRRRGSTREGDEHEGLLASPEDP